MVSMRKKESERGEGGGGNVSQERDMVKEAEENDNQTTKLYNTLAQNDENTPKTKRQLRRKK